MTKQVAEATNMGFQTFSYVEVTFNGKPSQSHREAMKAAGLSFNGTVWYGRDTEAAKNALEGIGRDLLAKQAPAPAAKATTGSGKTAIAKATAVAKAKADLVERLSAQGRTPEDIKAILEVTF
jgi:hypothetical protein